MSSKKLKIAVPTDDGEIICSHSGFSRGFLVFTIKCKEIITKEMRWNFLSEILTSEHGVFYNLVDCDLIIHDEKECFSGNGDCTKIKRFVSTKKKVVTEAVADYLTKHHLAELS